MWPGHVGVPAQIVVMKPHQVMNEVFFNSILIIAFNRAPCPLQAFNFYGNPVYIEPAQVFTV